MALGGLILLGFASAAFMEHEGHYITGMNNQIVWGLPHIFAVTLIVIASGVLNIASLSSAFNKKLYKPLAPLSALSAIAFLIAGLIILVLDLGEARAFNCCYDHLQFQIYLCLEYFPILRIFCHSLGIYLDNA